MSSRPCWLQSWDSKVMLDLANSSFKNHSSVQWYTILLARYGKGLFLDYGLTKQHFFKMFFQSHPVLCSTVALSLCGSSCRVMLVQVAVSGSKVLIIIVQNVCLQGRLPSCWQKRKHSCYIYSALFVFNDLSSHSWNAPLTSIDISYETSLFTRLVDRQRVP